MPPPLFWNNIPKIIIFHRTNSKDTTTSCHQTFLKKQASTQRFTNRSLFARRQLITATNSNEIIGADYHEQPDRNNELGNRKPQETRANERINIRSDYAIALSTIR